MKFKLTVLFILVFCTSVYIKAQTEGNKIINDSTIIFGLIPDDSYVGKSITGLCSAGYDNELKGGSIVIVSGTEKCTFLSENHDFYEIIYNTKTYFIEKEKMLIKDFTFDDINNLSSETANKFKNYSNQMSKLIYASEVNEAIKALKSCKTAGLSIYDWSYYDESEYTEGTSAKITVYNPTNKTIKYIWFSFVGFNPVGDRVVDRRSGSSVETVKAIGPIAKGETGSYSFEYVWFTDIVETAKIASIKVQYMDGTVSIIKNPKSITLSTKHKNILDEAMN